MSTTTTPARRRRLSAAAIGAVAAAALAAPALPAGAAVLPSSYFASVTPASSTVATSGTFTVTFTNDHIANSADPLAAASVTFPAGFGSLAAPATVQDTNGGSWTVTVAGAKVTLKSGLGLLPVSGQSVSVPVTTTTPTRQGSYPLTTTATGLLGDPFTLNGSQPTVNALPAAVSRLVYLQQPSTVVVGKPMSPTVRVAAEDTYGNIVGAFSGPVTLSTAFNPATGDATNPPGLPVTAAASSGVAAFPNLTIGSTGDGFVLAASTAGVPSIRSSSFDVASTATTCSATTKCDTGLTGSVSDTQAEVVTTPALIGSTPDAVYLTVGAGALASTCGSTASGSSQPANWTTVDTSRSVTVTMRLDKSVVNSAPNNGASTYGVCYTADKPFRTHSGATSAQDANGNYFGYLPDCSTTNNAAPCLIKLNKNGQGDVVASFSSFPGDPGGIVNIALPSSL